MGLINDIRQDLDGSALRLISEYRDRLFAEAVRMCNDVSTAEDLVSRTFDKAIRNLDSYTRDENLFGWMKTIMVNLRRDDLRHPVARNTTPVDPSVMAECSAEDWRTDEEILRRSDSEALRAALGRLDPEFKKTVVLHYLADMPVKQIAVILNMPVGTVLWRLNVARKILARDLADKLGKKPLAVLLAVLLGIGSLFGAWKAVEALTEDERGAVEASAAEFQDDADAAAQVEPSDRAWQLEQAGEGRTGDSAGVRRPDVPQAQTIFETQATPEGGKVMKTTKSIIATALSAVTALFGTTAAVATPVEGTPDTYLEYLEMTGKTQWISTGVCPDKNTRVVGTFAYDNYDDKTLYGARNGGFNMLLWARGSGGGSGANYGLNPQYVGSAAKGNKDTGAPFGKKFQSDFGPNGLYSIYNGTTTTLYTASSWGTLGTGKSKYPIILFGRADSASGAADRKYAGKFYDLQIYDGDEMVRDFRPCRKDGVVCLYDEVEGKLYYNDGTGVFKAGPALQPECSSAYDPATDTLTVSVKIPPTGATYRLEAVTTAAGETPVTKLIDAEASDPDKTYMATLSGFLDDKQYAVTVVAEGGGKTFNCPAGSFYTGAVTVSATDEADAAGGQPGLITFVRGESAVASDLVVNYSTTGGTAVVGTDYEALSGTVTIPAGKSSVTVPVVQRKTNHDQDRTLVITLEPGAYKVSATAGSATMTLKPQPVRWALNGTTLSDGVWTLTVSVSGNELTVTKYVSGAGVLDFTNLERDTGGYKVTAINTGVFPEYDENLTALIGPDIVTIGASAFLRSKVLRDVRVPKVEAIGKDAFYSCSKLKGDIWLPKVTSIPAGSFQSCGEITSVYAPLATSLGNSAFAYCSKLTNFVGGAEVTSLGVNAFYGCSKLKGDIWLPKVTSIPEGAFIDCWEITSVYAPLATSLGYNAFPRCYKLTTVVAAAGTIGNVCFYNCSALSSVTLTGSELAIGDSAFEGAGNCSLYVMSGFPVLGGTKCFSNSGTTMPLPRVYVSTAWGLESWRANCLATKETPGAYTAYFGTGKYAKDAPRRKTVGLVRLNTGTAATGYAWLVDGVKWGMTVIVR